MLDLSGAKIIVNERDLTVTLSDKKYILISSAKELPSADFLCVAFCDDYHFYANMIDLSDKRRYCIKGFADAEIEFKCEYQERDAGKNKFRLKSFLDELSILSQKYDMYIKGCGCCGSPWILDTETGNTFDNLEYMDDETGYEVEYGK